MTKRPGSPAVSLFLSDRHDFAVSDDAYARFRPALLRLDRRPTPLAAIAAALLPLAGVLLLDWPVAAMLGFYWIESVAIGLFHFLRMLSARGTPIDTALEGALARNTALTPEQRAQQLHAAYRIQHAVMPWFFLVHYGLFCLVHLGVIAFVFDAAFDDLGAWLGLATIALIVLQQLADTLRFRRDADLVALPRGALLLQP